MIKEQSEKIKAFVDGLIEASTPQSPAWNMEAKMSDKPARWNYVDGCMIKAVLSIYDVTKEQKYLDFADAFTGFFISEDGEILGYKKEDYNCDHINAGKNLFDLYRLTGKEKYRRAIDTLYAQLLEQPRTQAGNFWHKKIYPNQVWLDGLYMAQPFYMEYEMLFNQKRNYKDIFRQFESARACMRDTHTNLLYHGYDESRESFWADKITGNSPCFWSRSLGWYTMALVDIIDKFDERLFHEYMTLQEYLKEVIDALLKWKDPEQHMFYQVTDKPGQGNYLETSGTCAIAYSIIKGARRGWLPSYYYDYGLEIFDSVLASKLEATGDNFVLKDICLVAGLGGMPGKGSRKLRDGTYEYYLSEPVVNNDAKGVAPFLFTYAEICKEMEL